MKAESSTPPGFPVHIISVPGLFPRWVKAQTWWNVILVKRGVRFTERYLAHELAHVLQWRTFGVFRFMFSYLRDLILYGYDGHPLEIEARSAETNEYFLNWAREILQRRQKPRPGAGGPEERLA